MKNINCPDCGQKQWSIADCNYVILYKTCWRCDKKRWDKKKLTLKEFEEREKNASKSIEL